MDPPLKKGRKSDHEIQRPRNRSTSKRRKTIGPQLKENPMPPKTPTNVLPNDEVSVRNPLMLGSATSYYFRGAPPTPVQKMVQEEQTKRLLEESLNNDDTLNPPTSSSYLSSSSSEASQDPLNVSTLSDTTELAASSFVALAATQRPTTTSLARPPLGIRRRTIGAPSTKANKRSGKERRASLAPRATSEQTVSADDEHTGEILLSHDMQALLHAGTLSDDEDIAPPRRKSLTYGDDVDEMSQQKSAKRQTLANGDTADIGDLFNDDLFNDGWPTDDGLVAQGESGSTDQTQGVALLQDQEVVEGDLRVNDTPKTAHTDDHSRERMQEESPSTDPQQLPRRKSLRMHSAVRNKTAHQAQAIDDTELSMVLQESPSKSREAQIDRSPRRKSSSKRAATELKSPPRGARRASNTGVADSPARNTRSAKVARVDKSASTISSATKKSRKPAAAQSPPKGNPKDQTIMLDSPARNTRSKSPKKNSTPTSSVVKKKRLSVQKDGAENESEPGADDSNASFSIPSNKTSSPTLQPDPTGNGIDPVRDTGTHSASEDSQDRISEIKSKGRTNVSQSTTSSSPVEKKHDSLNDEELSLKSGSSDEDEPAGSYLLNSDNEDETGDFWSGLVPKNKTPEDSGGGVNEDDGARDLQSSTRDQPRKENQFRTGQDNPENQKRKVFSSTRQVRSLLGGITNGEVPAESVTELDTKETNADDEIMLSGTTVDAFRNESSEIESNSVGKGDGKQPARTTLTTTREVSGASDNAIDLNGSASVSLGDNTTTVESSRESDQQTTSVSLGGLLDDAGEQEEGHESTAEFELNPGVNFDTMVSAAFLEKFETHVGRQDTTSSLGRILESDNESGGGSLSADSFVNSSLMNEGAGNTTQGESIAPRENATAASSSDWIGSRECHDRDTTASFGGILDESETSKASAEERQNSGSNQSLENLPVHCAITEDTALSLGGILGGPAPSADGLKESTSTRGLQNATATHSLGALLDGTDPQQTSSTLASTGAGANRTATVSLNNLLNGFTPTKETIPSTHQRSTDTSTSAHHDTAQSLLEHSSNVCDIPGAKPIMSGKSQQGNAIGTVDGSQTTPFGRDISENEGVSITSLRQDGTVASLQIGESLSPASGITTPESMAHLFIHKTTGEDKNSPARPRIVEFPVAKSPMASSLTPTKLRGQPRRVPGSSPKTLPAHRRSTTPTQLKLPASRFSLPPQLPKSSSKKSGLAATGLKAPPQRRLNSPGGVQRRQSASEFPSPERPSQSSASPKLSNATPVASKESLPSKGGLLSALRPPGSKRKQSKSVCFGSPEMAEYDAQQNPAAGLTPMPRTSITESKERVSAISGSPSNAPLALQGQTEMSDGNSTSPDSDMSTESIESETVLEDDTWDTTIIRELDSSRLPNEVVQTQLSVDEQTLTLETDFDGLLENPCDTAVDQVDGTCGVEQSTSNGSLELQTIDCAERFQFPTNKKQAGSEETTVELEINMHELLNQSPTRNSGNDISASDKKILWPQDSVDVQHRESPDARHSISSHSIRLNSRSRLSISSREQAPDTEDETHPTLPVIPSPPPASLPSIRVGQIVPCSKGWPPSPPRPDPLLETLEQLHSFPVSDTLNNLLEVVICYIHENTTLSVELDGIISPTGYDDRAYFRLQESLKEGSDSGLQCLATDLYCSEAIEFFGWLVRVSEKVESSLSQQAGSISIRVDDAESFAERVDSVVTSIGNLSARSAKQRNMVERKGEISTLQTALREKQKHRDTLKNLRLESLRNLLESQRLKPLDQTKRREAGSLAKSFSIAKRFSRMSLRCASDSEFHFEFIGDTPKSCFVFDMQWKSRLECRCSSNPTLFSNDGLLKAHTLSSAASYLESRFQDLCKVANRTDLKAPRDIAPLLQRMACDFTRVDVVARELSSVKRTYKAALVPSASPSTFRVQVDFSYANGVAALRATFEISESYPNGPMETNLDVFSESLDSKLLCSYLIKRAKPGIGYLSRTCACLTALVRSETPNRKQTT